MGAQIGILCLFILSRVVGIISLESFKWVVWFFFARHGDKAVMSKQWRD